MGLVQGTYQRAVLIKMMLNRAFIANGEGGGDARGVISDFSILEKGLIEMRVKLSFYG